MNVEYCFAQFQPDLRLTNDPFPSSTSYNNARCIAANGLIVHVVWHDARNTVNNYEIYYKRSTDGGLSWGADTRLTNTNNSSSELVTVSVSGSVVHLVWLDYREGNAEIFYKRSTDDGSSWETDLRLTNNTFDSQSPSLSVSGQFLHTVWYDNRDGNYEIYYKRSTDGGTSWGTDTRLTNNSGQSWYPSVSVSGSSVHVVWYDGRDGNDEIYYKRSSDSGVSWGADTRLTSNTAISQRPSVAAAGSDVHVVWTDFRDGSDAEIYFKRSGDGGANWETDTRLTNTIGISYNPCVTVSGSALHLVWYDNRDGNQEIYYKRSTNSGTNWGADTRLTINIPGISYLPSVAVSGSAVHVVWSDDRNSNYEIYYKRDSTGNPTGIININSEIPDQFSLLQNYPNPFNPVTNIKFSIPKSGNAKLIVYDISGKEMMVLVNGSLNAGTYTVELNASNLASGVYFYRIETSGFTDIKKLVVVK
ncbi:MAG: T9SS type A sorting domain-containing protein [Ignavibacteria bacterium]|nr:T9SS type A sorting domain-containing protein [Ignavibacteria bacterium]